MGVDKEEKEELLSRIRGEWIREALYGKGGASVEERGALRALIEVSIWTEARCCEEGYIKFPL